MKRFVALFLAVLYCLLLVPLSVSAEETNLALRKSITVESHIANSQSYNEVERIDSPQVLTDGVYRKADYGDTGWMKFYRATGRTLTVDLEQICTVERVFTRFMQNSQAGIVAPKKIEVYTSCDGSNFVKAEILSGGESPFIPSHGNENFVAEYDIRLTPIRARYVAISFDVTVNSFTDELEIYGKVGSELAERTDYCDILKEPVDKYLDRSALDGDTDIVCFHAGYSPDNEIIVNNTKDGFLPYVAYIDEKKKITDTMFDSVMFLIYQGKCPSGGNLTIAGGTTVMSDWEMLLDSYFAEDYNLSALDAATAELKQTLSLADDHKTSVYLTVPYPKISDNDFGDYDGNGVSNKIDSYEACLAVTEWFMDEVDRRFEAAGFENIELRGYFCNSEGLTRQYYDYEFDFARDAAKLMRDRGLKCVMIPYYQAVGIDANEELMFDAMLMQPNLSFNDTLKDNPEGMMLDFAETAKQFGLGIQMEIADGVRWEPDELGKYYMQYLVSASRNGLMTDTVHAYYNGAGPGVFYDCAKSSKPNLRIYYDLTYKFIKGTLDFPQEVLAQTVETDFECTASENLIGETGVLGDWFCSYRFISEPEHGYVNISDGGKTFRYRADRNYSGEDGFEYEILYAGEVIATRKMNITVKSTFESEEAESQTAESIPDTEKNGGGTLVVVIAVIGVIALILAVFLVKARLKK